MSAVESATKTCTGCGETKNLAEFYRDKGASDGRYARCKGCLRPYFRDRARARREADPEGESRRQREAQRRYRERGGVETDRRQSRAWRKATTRLREHHEREWQALYRQARDEEGLPPL